MSLLPLRPVPAIPRLKTTYVDSCVLMAAFKSTDAAHARARAVLADRTRTFYTGDFVKMETLPAHRRRDPRETAYYEAFFARAIVLNVNPQVTAMALDFKKRVPMQFADALHMATAVVAQADEFVTAESPSNPFFQLTGAWSTRTAITSICPDQE